MEDVNRLNHFNPESDAPFVLPACLISHTGGRSVFSLFNAFNSKSLKAIFVSSYLVYKCFDKNPESDAPFVYKTIDLLVKKLNVPLIGFSGAPFTLACYMTEGAGSKSFLEIRKMMLNTPDMQALVFYIILKMKLFYALPYILAYICQPEIRKMMLNTPDVFHSLMKKLTEDTIKYLQNQVKHGCAAIQMFDTWAGILPPAEYKEMVFPYVKEISESIFCNKFLQNISHMKVYYISV